MDEKIYVSDYIGDAFLRWQKGDKIIISTPTGSGKTTFVVSTLLRYAVEQDKHIVYYCNRKVLHDQYLKRSKNDIAWVFGDCAELTKEASDHLHILTYQSSELTGNYPRVSVPLEDESTQNILILEPENILYYIFDEAHYCINDANINARTNYWYDKKFEDGISIFLTATPKPLLGMFEGWNRLSTESNRDLYREYKRRDRIKYEGEELVSEIIHSFLFDCGKRIRAKLPASRGLLDATIRHHVNPLENWFLRISNTYQGKNQTNIVYSYSPDYSYVNPVYFMEFEELMPEIRKSVDKDEKWLIFVDDESLGSDFAKRINLEGGISAVFISSGNVKRGGSAREVYEWIVSDKTFPVDVLISTSVLDCGIDIKDDSLKNIVIASDNETTFLQMLGRKRVKPFERIRLFIKVYNYLTIHNRYNRCTKELRFMLKLSLKNDTTLIRPGISTPNRDGNTYGSALSADDLDSLLDDFITIAKPALIRRTGKPIEADCNGYVKEKQMKQLMNNELHLMEYKYSETALINLLLRMYDYHQAMSNYRKENESFVKLCAHTHFCLTHMKAQEVNNGVKTCLQLNPEIVRNREKYFPFLAENKPTVTEVDCRYNVERDLTFYLRKQLSWIGKEYDVNCWLGYEEKNRKLIQYLDYIVEKGQWLREDDTWHEQYDFAINCMELILALPIVPRVLSKDKSRYSANPGTYPSKNKLEKCFIHMSLPYRIGAEQRRYEGKRKTCWKLYK